MSVLNGDNERRHPRAERDRPVTPRHESRHWLSINEACRLLGVDQSTLRRWSDAGKVPVFRTPGGHRRYAEDDLLTLLGEKSRPAPYLAVAPAQSLHLEHADGPSAAQAGRAAVATAPGQLPHRANEVLRRIAELLSAVRGANLDAAGLSRNAALVRQAGLVLGNVCAAAHHGATEMVAALIALRPRLPYGTPADHIAMAAVRQSEAASHLLDQAVLSAVQAHADATMAALSTPYVSVADAPLLGDA